MLAKYLEEREGEVEDIMMTLFSQEEVNERYGYECREEGTTSATIKHLKKLMKKMDITPEEAMDMLDIPATDRSRYVESL